MERTNQGGSVLSFVIVGVLLAGLLVGGVYLVNRQTAGQSPTPVVQKPQEKPNNQTPPPAEPGNDEPSSSTNMSGSGSATNNHVTELPTTGPRETIYSMIIVGLLSGALAGFLRSRRPQLSL